MGFVIERRDEYQLCTYILSFKGYQFFSTGLFSLLSFAAVDAYCVSWAPIEEMYACRSTGLNSGLGLGLRPNPSPNPNQVRVPQHGSRSASGVHLGGVLLRLGGPRRLRRLRAAALHHLGRRHHTRPPHV